MTRLRTLKNPEKVPPETKELFDNVSLLTNEFCGKFLDEEYAALVRKLTASLCRKRTSPLKSGRLQTWAAGLVHAICMVNFRFDRSQQPSISSREICNHFGLAQSTVGNKSKEIRDLFKMTQWDPNWMPASRVDDSPLVWMISLNGFIVDSRQLPRHIQEEAVATGIIPYVPEN